MRGRGRRRNRERVVRVHPNLEGRRVAVPRSYFGQEGDGWHGGLVGTWRRYFGQDLNEYWGYEIIFDAGDKYDLLEADVWSYLTPDCEEGVGVTLSKPVSPVSSSSSSSSSEEDDGDVFEEMTIQEMLSERFHVD